MIENLIKETIEKRTKEITVSNPFLGKARKGTLTKNEVAQYLFNLIYIFSQTPGHLKMASKRAREMGLPELAEFMELKIPEEKGHENWPKEDLKKSSFQKAEGLHITSASKNVMKQVELMIEEDPHFYLCYLAFVEYFTVLVAPEFLSNLEQKCGIPPTQMTAVLNHQISDKDHIQQDLVIMGQLLREPELIERSIEALVLSASAVDAALTSCMLE